jgi:hypothetical protein
VPVAVHGRPLWPRAIMSHLRVLLLRLQHTPSKFWNEQRENAVLVISEDRPMLPMTTCRLSEPSATDTRPGCVGCQLLRLHAACDAYWSSSTPGFSCDTSGSTPSRKSTTTPLSAGSIQCVYFTCQGPDCHGAFNSLKHLGRYFILMILWHLSVFSPAALKSSGE